MRLLIFPLLLSFSVSQAQWSSVINRPYNSHNNHQNQQPQPQHHKKQHQQQQQHQHYQKQQSSIGRQYQVRDSNSFYNGPTTSTSFNTQQQVSSYSRPVQTSYNEQPSYEHQQQQQRPTRVYQSQQPTYPSTRGFNSNPFRSDQQLSYTQVHQEPQFSSSNQVHQQPQFSSTSSRQVLPSSYPAQPSRTVQTYPNQPSQWIRQTQPPKYVFDIC
jgi:hypothetical protein